MIFKIIIVILAASMLISLFSSAFFLFRDKGSTSRAFYSLRVRVAIALLLLATIAVGISTGNLEVGAPWG
ncbi:DUF2909 domain-containing protein [SAR86 cluster bacterium]|jgi:hypothetical protein|nr:DUF2909 domain-containing protein [SAR86 cluster bacterium]MEC7787240.1 DUF2909 domain-containing protein [Pseudomonadota bacterium]GIR10826.1 MAG: hypothetical protein CM15mP22_2460 [Gammaproteobacteria bacterium]|tara:strand:+ start:516 stop:725 length:210 start_codon:yes stop_codon:yes gene_type:complete